MPVISFQIDSATLEGLDHLAKNGASRDELLRQAVREFVAARLAEPRVIDMNDQDFDTFMASLDAEPTAEEQEGSRRLQNLHYPWREARDAGPDFQSNPETESAMREAERLARDPKAKRYHSVEEALKTLKE